jgi:hypothetical protein
MYAERDHLEMYFKNVLIQLSMSNEDRHTAKLITLNNRVPMKIIQHNALF